MATINLAYSSEMMENYLQAELISPQEKFEALQTADGHSLLFSIGTDGVFYLFQEESESSAGWSKIDLSSTQIEVDFSGQPNVICDTFEVGQSVDDGSLGMAMVVSTSSGDQLYLCLGNSNNDLSWANSPNWVSYDYDNPNIELSKLDIVNVFLCEPAGGTQYIIVDVVRDPENVVKNISRFYIDLTADEGYHWNSHDVPIDIESDKYDSCLGRKYKESIDGTYTCGSIVDSGQLVFVPVINVYGEGSPSVTRLNLPGNAVPNAMTATRNTDLSTDLFVVSGNTLYYFASSNQADSTEGTPLNSYDVISGTSKLCAMSHDGLITLWGRNASDQVYYTSCSQSEVSDPKAWSVPIPILSGIEKISPYINKVNGGNTIFVAGGEKLHRISKNTESKVWQTDQITLPIPPEQPSISFNSYTTTIQVSDEQDLPLGQVYDEQGLPTVKGISVNLSASNPCSVYINGLYYVLDKTPIHIEPNAFGTITIIESVGTLSGTTFTVSTENGSSITINPMERSFKKIVELNSPEKLRAATIIDDNGNTKPLIPSDTSDSDVETLAKALGDLSKHYDKLQSDDPPDFATLALASPNFAEYGIIDTIVDEVGDLFNWLKSGVEAVIEIIEDVATKTLHFIAKIAGKVYGAVLDTIEAIVEAVVWVFNAIKVIIEDIIKFLMFLFDWDDITRTKDVLHNLIKRYLEGQVSGIQGMRQGFDNMIDEVESSINNWAGIEDWSGLGSPAHKPASGSASNPMPMPMPMKEEEQEQEQEQTSASQHLVYHFQNNVEHLSILDDVSEPSLLESLIEDLWTALENEAKAFDEVLDQLDDLMHDFSELTVEQVLKRLAAILVDGVLSSTQVVVDVLFDILSDVAETLLKILDAKIHIPIISDILNAIGVEDISFLDLFCWIAAVANTLGYKVVNREAPFPDNENTSFLINAPTLKELQEAFGQLPTSAPMTEGRAVIPQMPQEVKNAVFITGHSAASLFTLIGSGVKVFEAEAKSGNKLGKPSAILSIISAGSVGIANILVPKYPIENEAVHVISEATTGIRVLCKIMFSGPIQSKFGAPKSIMKRLVPNDGRASGAIIDMLLTIPAYVCTGWHLYELSQDAAGEERADAILGEVSNLASYTSRNSYAFAVNDKDPESKAILIGIMVVADVAYAGLQAAQAIVN